MSVRKGQVRLGKIAKQLESNSSISGEDRLFLSSALKAIADGRDAENALGVKAKRGERKGKHTRDNETMLQYFYPWIGTAISSEGGEPGLSVGQACQRISEITFSKLRLSPQTIRRYWDKNKNRYKPRPQPRSTYLTKK